MDAYSRLAPFIREYIYVNRWTELREVQVAACDVLFHSESDLLLSSGTASGKTEAAFLPALTLLYENPSRSVGILYVAPLKALINDQFQRLEPMLADCGIPVCKWHGDAPDAGKRRLLAKPQGVLQITPESLESMLMNRRADCIRLFADLRFVIIDEVHYFMGSSRGIQLLCLLERIQTLCACLPRRIGLSATMSDLRSAQDWLSRGTGRPCEAPRVSGAVKRIRVSMEYFVTQDGKTADPDKDPGWADFYRCLYEKTVDKKAILFANSRAEAEKTIRSLKRQAKSCGTPDCYHVHHGSISALLREETEQAMKKSDGPIVTGATLTLELGIDIGSLDCIVQSGAPFSVSSLVQRMGRCGRRGQTAEMLFTVMEEDPSCKNGLDAVFWELLEMIAIFELYTKEKWTEPAAPQKLPYALVYHQTVSCLYSQGEMSASSLARTVLRMTPFRHVSVADYTLMLKYMLAAETIQKTERGGLILGEAGEKAAGRYEFYSVFESPAEYLVKCGNEPIGTVTGRFHPGDLFVLAGRSWEVLEGGGGSVIFVKEANGASESAWQSAIQVSLHEKVLHKMRDVLSGGESCAYLSAACAQRLAQMRSLAGSMGLPNRFVIETGENTYAILPWFGSRQLFSLYHLLLRYPIRCAILPDKIRPVYLQIRLEGGARRVMNLLKEIADSADSEIDLPDSAEIYCKYNDCIPRELRAKQYREDFLDIEGTKKALRLLIGALKRQA